MSECGCDAHQSVSSLKPVEEALNLLLRQAKPVAERETLSTSAALGRVLAEPVTSMIDVPPWHNSAMDGYAVNSVDLQGISPRLSISQRIPAGAAGTMLAPGTAARIFTGAPIPPGADTVVIQEATHKDGNAVIIDQVPTIPAHETAQVNPQPAQPNRKKGKSPTDDRPKQVPDNIMDSAQRRDPEEQAC